MSSHFISTLNYTNERKSRMVPGFTPAQVRGQGATGSSGLEYRPTRPSGPWRKGLAPCLTQEKLRRAIALTVKLGRKRK
jgi:hypothetical protein